MLSKNTLPVYSCENKPYLIGMKEKKLIFSKSDSKVNLSLSPENFCLVFNLGFECTDANLHHPVQSFNHTQDTHSSEKTKGST